MIKRPKRVEQSEALFEGRDNQIPYVLKRSSARRTLTICIDEEGELSVSVPMRTPDKEIKAFLFEKENWIVDKIKESKTRHSKIEERKFEDGYEFLYLGEKFPLKTLLGDVKRVKVEFLNDAWYLTLPIGLKGKEKQKRIRTALVKWYRKQAEEIIGGRLLHFARIIGVEPEKIAVRTQKRLWGICHHTAKTIHINWQIILAPMAVVDYVVIHELCHLIVPNHSKRFWNQVARYMPEYELHERWLKEHAVDMVLPQVK